MSSSTDAVEVSFFLIKPTYMNCVEDTKAPVLEHFSAVAISFPTNSKYATDLQIDFLFSHCEFCVIVTDLP